MTDAESSPHGGPDPDDDLAAAGDPERTPGDGLDYEPGTLAANVADPQRPGADTAVAEPAEMGSDTGAAEASCFAPLPDEGDRAEGGAEADDGAEGGADFTERVSAPDEPRHRTMIEAFRYGWGNGERKLMIAGAITSVMFSALAFLLGVNFFAEVTSTSSHPYDVEIPVRIMDRVPGVGGPATNGDRVTVSIEGCNNTEDVLLLSFIGQWVRYDDSTQRGPTYLVPAQLVNGVAVPPGGVLCGDGSQPTITQLPLPEEVMTDPGTWQISVQVEVRKCAEPLISSQIGAQALSCRSPGEVLDHVGWFTQTFEVLPPSDSEAD